MQNIYFTSDTHYNHKNIVRGTSEWGDEGPQRTRDFDTLEEHNKALVTSINSVVKEDDVLYHLGDWSFGGINSIWEFRKQLKCKEVHLIFGNHDEHIVANKPIPEHQLLEVKDWVWKTLKPSAFPERPGLRDLFASCDYYKELNLKVDCQKSGKFGKQLFCLSHYAHRVWNKSHKGSIMLYGHSHGTLDEMKPDFANPTWIGDNYFIKNYKTMDVGADTNNLYPYHIDEILERMKTREVLLNVDHHSKETN